MQIHVSTAKKKKKEEGDCLHKNSSGGAFKGCQEDADFSESDSVEGLESTYPDHKKTCAYN